MHSNFAQLQVGDIRDDPLVVSLLQEVFLVADTGRETV